MTHNSYCNREARQRPIKRALLCVALLAGVLGEGLVFSAQASDQAPPWMHAVANAAVPAHDEKTNAVVLYSEDILRVDPNGKIKSTERRVYKILRPDGRKYGTAYAEFDPDTKITSMHGWCIPAEGKDFEVGEKQAMETGLTDVENGILMTDQRMKLLKIPAADVGNIVGYEIEQEDRPYVLQDVWGFQRSVPVAQSHYTLQLPSGWEYKAVWINHPEVKAVAGADNTWQWTVENIPGIRDEDDMPPWRAVVGQMVLTLLPPGGEATKKGFETWTDMGRWQAQLAQGKRDASPEIKQKVAELTAGATTPLEKMEAIANFMQQEIRYVGIELGIGGLPAPRCGGRVYAPLRRLQGQGDADELDAARNWHRFVLHHYQYAAGSRFRDDSADHRVVQSCHSGDQVAGRGGQSRPGGDVPGCETREIADL